MCAMIFEFSITHKITQIFNYFLFVITVVFFSSEVEAQQKQSLDSLVIGSEILVNPASLGDDLPFWFHNQRFGIVDQNSANGILYAYFNTKLMSTERIDLSITAMPVVRNSSHYSMFFNLGDITARYRGFKLSAGRFVDPLAEKENPLSTGSFIVSRNATPIPKIAFYTDGFIPVPGLQGIVNFKGFYSHGWFEDDRYVKDVYLHQKYFYLNIKYAFFDAIGGIVHNAQWGGSSPDSEIPNDFNTYVETVFVLGSSNQNAPRGEQVNAVGNSVAAYDFSLGLDFKPFNFRIYRLFYLEDKVSTRFRSPWDGIWGAVITPKKSALISTILYEHVNTKKQDAFDFEPYGTANYYNHFIYRSGWAYERRVIGNSLITTNGGEDQPIINNIIIAHHIGFSGFFSQSFDYKFKFTFSRNYGIYRDQVIERYNPEESTIVGSLIPISELKKLNQSFFFELGYTIPNNPNINIKASTALDVGELYGNRMGLGLGIKYSID